MNLKTTHWSLRGESVLSARLYIALGFMLFGSIIGQVVAQEAPAKQAGAKTEVALVAEVKSIAPGKAFDVAIRLSMPPGWHTYWKYPGDSGMATRVTWDLPEGFRARDLEWPVPERVELTGMVCYGYHGEVYLTSTIIPSLETKVGSKVELKAKVEWIECLEGCFPGEATVSLTLPVVKRDPAPDNVHGVRIEGVRQRLPEDPLPDQFMARREGDEWVLEIRKAIDEGAEVLFIPETPGAIVAIAPQPIKRIGNKTELHVQVSSELDPAVTHVQGIIVLPGEAWRVKFAVAAPVMGRNSVDSAARVSYVAALLLALIGGLVLNLMPCVLPVLSLKVMGFIQDAGGDERKAWHHGLAFTAGVLASFWALAGALIFLRAGGEQLGWGFQLQSPIFVSILCGVLTLVGLNLFGLFEVGTGLVSLQGAVSGVRGLAASFGSGILATAVATPCTAPFMGTALGFALAQPAMVALSIFTALGLGMSLPYLVLSAKIEWLKWVPKPGAWMVTFKQAMGFPMLATVAWLLWVLGKQAGVDAVIALLFGLIILALGSWIVGRSEKYFFKLTGLILLLAGWGGGVWAVKNISGESTPGAIVLSDNWEPYDPGRLASLRATGTPVFIDFTAAWCLTCQVNEKTVLASTEVVKAFEANRVVKMKADWTRRDAEITKALASFGRSGVPVYVVYGKSPGIEPVVLPEILNAALVIEALEKAGKTASTP